MIRLLVVVVFVCLFGFSWYKSTVQAASNELSRTTVVKAVSSLGLKHGATIRLDGSSYTVQNVAVNSEGRGTFTIRFTAIPND